MLLRANPASSLQTGFFVNESCVLQIEVAILTKCGSEFLDQRPLAVHHDLAEHRTEESAPPVGHSPRLYVDVASHHGFDALYVQLGLEESVIQARNEAAHVGRLVHLLLASFAVHVYGQLVQVVHVVPVRGSGVCKNKR